ncbi:hypothetical protein COZ39_04200 [Candidatus Roizmanbacteria bacterium CG_4_10_14_3_um_filter_33_21]|uniref:Uncharacterized protein n=2 Tax=Candidatus Roizmaniibacteriota TaxID=1752723 RepID=A0A2M7LS05_9BACT|nr:MAG: hypothetical protein COZ39_04200 [Candidatus Roizmanbacteria bacterium CG_4_10_14_3_um_filter_33_21]
MINLLMTFPKEIQIIIVLAPFFLFVIILGIVFKKVTYFLSNYLVFWIFLLIVLFIFYRILSSRLSFFDNPAAELMIYVLMFIVGYFIYKKNE